MKSESLKKERLSDVPPLFFYPGPKRRQRMEEVSAKMGINLAEICRRGVDLWIEQNVPQQNATSEPAS